MSAAQMIDDQSAFDALVDDLTGQSAVAIDCEMDSMFAYRTSLCVVQLAWDGGEVLVDAMVDMDRSRLGVIMADPAVVKVFHGGENDIGLLRAQWGFEFENIFDSMVASQVLGLEGVGLAASLKRHFDVHVSKKYQKADWRVRPLPPDQADYARMDVRYLLELREILLAELEELDRVEEATSEFVRIQAAHHEAKPFVPDSWARAKSARRLDPGLRGIFRELFVVRDDIARRHNQAPYRVLQESTLIDLCHRRPGDLRDLRELRGISRRLSDADMELFLEAIRRGEELGEIPVPKNRGSWDPSQASGGPLSPEQQRLYDRLRDWRSTRARKRGVEVARVATNVLLGAITRAGPKSIDELERVRGMESWRMREYGEELLRICCGDAGKR